MIVPAIGVWDLSHSSDSKWHAIASRNKGCATRAGPIADSVGVLSCGYRSVRLQEMGQTG
jgi:hypothetical protein